MMSRVTANAGMTGRDRTVPSILENVTRSAERDVLDRVMSSVLPVQPTLIGIRKGSASAILIGRQMTVRSGLASVMQTVLVAEVLSILTVMPVYQTRN
jgi:hypothetical protein